MNTNAAPGSSHQRPQLTELNRQIVWAHGFGNNETLQRVHGRVRSSYNKNVVTWPEVSPALVSVWSVWGFGAVATCGWDDGDWGLLQKNLTLTCDMCEKCQFWHHDYTVLSIWPLFFSFQSDNTLFPCSVINIFMATKDLLTQHNVKGVTCGESHTKCDPTSALWPGQHPQAHCFGFYRTFSFILSSWIRAVFFNRGSKKNPLSTQTQLGSSWWTQWSM